MSLIFWLPSFCIEITYITLCWFKFKCGSYENVIQKQRLLIHTSRMILCHLKLEWNILTGIQDICTIHLINILALGAERITVVSASRKNDIFTSKVLMLLLSCQKQYTKKKTIFQKWCTEKFLEGDTWCKSHRNLKLNSNLPQKILIYFIDSLKKFLIYFIESLLKMLKNAFYIIFKALFVLKIFKFLSWLFGHMDKRGLMRKMRLIWKFMTSQSG